jgi:hypothetical protein
MMLATVCGPAHAEPNQSVQSEVQPAAVGGVGSCDVFVTACNADRSATYECLLGVPIFHSPNVWGNEQQCAGPGYCISHNDENGNQADFCGQCIPGTKYCDGKRTQWCDSLGQWVPGAACTIPCQCGKLPNGMCRICE